MKKNYTLFAAFAMAAIFVSCSDKMDESTASTLYNEDEIGFLSSTSRATVVTIDELMDANTGFNVYATNGSDDAMAEFIDGASYVYGDSWGWNGTSYSWPSEADEYPINFYALYLPDYTGVNFEVGSGSATLAPTVAIAAADSQFDMLRATSTADNEPVGGKITLDFAHILSRVNFNVEVGDESTVYVIKSDLRGFEDTNVYDAVSHSWGENGSGSADYSYITISNPTNIIEVSGGSSISDADITNLDLMLMPHTFTVWDLADASSKDTDGSPLLSGGRVELFYRMTESNGTDYVGYGDATLHPNYTAATGLDADDSLFIKIAMPLAAEGDDTGTWAMGKNYSYLLTLSTTASSNGYYADTVYYDQDGNRTDLPVIPVGGDDDEEVEVGDLVTTGEICFEITVADWGDPVGTSLN